MLWLVRVLVVSCGSDNNDKEAGEDYTAMRVTRNVSFSLQKFRNYNNISKQWSRKRQSASSSSSDPNTIELILVLLKLQRATNSPVFWFPHKILKDKLEFLSYLRNAVRSLSGLNTSKHAPPSLTSFKKTTLRSAITTLFNSEVFWKCLRSAEGNVFKSSWPIWMLFEMIKQSCKIGLIMTDSINQILTQDRICVFTGLARIPSHYLSQCTTSQWTLLVWDTRHKLSTFCSEEMTVTRAGEAVHYSKPVGCAFPLHPNPP